MHALIVRSPRGWPRLCLCGTSFLRGVWLCDRSGVWKRLAVPRFAH